MEGVNGSLHDQQGQEQSPEVVSATTPTATPTIKHTQTPPVSQNSGVSSQQTPYNTNNQTPKTSPTASSMMNVDSMTRSVANPLQPAPPMIPKAAPAAPAAKRPSNPKIKAPTQKDNADNLAAVNPQDNNAHDVLFGRGKGATDWIGNRRYHELIRSKVPEYERLERNREKKLVTIEIVEIIKQRGGRFLRFVSHTGEEQDHATAGGGHFVLVPDNTARIKVGQALRHAMRDMNGTLQRSSSTSQSNKSTPKSPPPTSSETTTTPASIPHTNAATGEAAVPTAHVPLKKPLHMGGGSHPHVPPVPPRMERPPMPNPPGTTAKPTMISNRDSSLGGAVAKQVAEPQSSGGQSSGGGGGGEKRLTWEEMFGLLVEYKNTFGHTTPTQSETFRGQPIGSWAKYQRNLYSRLYLKHGPDDKAPSSSSKRHAASVSLNHKRIEQLNQIGFKWVTQSTGRSFQLQPKIVKAELQPPPTTKQKKRPSHSEPKSQSPRKKPAHSEGDRPAGVTRERSSEIHRRSSAHSLPSHRRVSHSHSANEQHEIAQQQQQQLQQNQYGALSRDAIYQLDEQQQRNRAFQQALGQALNAAPGAATRVGASQLAEKLRQSNVFQAAPSGIYLGRDASKALASQFSFTPAMLAAANQSTREDNSAQLAKAEAYLAKARKKAAEEYEEWMTMVHLLKQYKLEHHHVCPTLAETFRGQPLGAWVHSLRTPERIIMLTQQMQRHLDEIGFVWRPEQERPPPVTLPPQPHDEAAGRAVEPLLLYALNQPVLDGTQGIIAAANNSLQEQLAQQVLLQHPGQIPQSLIAGHLNEAQRMTQPSVAREHHEEEAPPETVATRRTNIEQAERMNIEQAGNDNENPSETETEEASSSSSGEEDDDDDDDDDDSAPPPPSHVAPSHSSPGGAESPPRNVIWTRRPSYDADSGKEDGIDESNSGAVMSEGGDGSEKFVTFNPELDIICSRDVRTASRNPGNQKYKVIIERHSMMYQESKQAAPGKALLTRKIMDEVQAAGGRFVKFDPLHKRWIELSDADKRWKIGKALRDAPGNPRSIEDKKPASSPNNPGSRSAIEVLDRQTRAPESNLQEMTSTKPPPAAGDASGQKSEEMVRRITSSQSTPSKAKVMSFF